MSKRSKEPEVVGREVLEKAGLNVKELIDKLVAAVAAEFTTYYYYTILRMHLTGMEGEGLKEIAEDARLEDRLHFELMTPRIYELGGQIPNDIRKFADLAACPDAYLPKDWKDPKTILEVLLKAEQCAIRVWTDVCNMTLGKDPGLMTWHKEYFRKKLNMKHGSWSFFTVGLRGISEGDFQAKDLGRQGFQALLKK